MTSLTDIKALIIDMDGVLWHGEQALPGLTEFFKVIEDSNIRYILATNNASLTADQYVNKLARMGVTVCQSAILTSGMATALYLSKLYTPEQTQIFVVGEYGARQPLIDLGFALVDSYPEESVHTENNHESTIVVCGKDETLNWQKLANASLYLGDGARFIGTNADTTLPTERGLTLGNGAILAALQTATGIEPTIIGKPEPIMYQQALEILQTEPEYTVAIGDRLETDILGAVRTGIRSIMVLTGVSKQEDIESCDYQPTAVLYDIREITQLLQYQG